MLVFECPFCKTTVPTTEDRSADPMVCPTCRTEAGNPDGLQQTAMLHDPRRRQAREEDDEDEGITTPENARSKRKRQDDDDDDDDDRPRKKRSASGSGAGTAVAGAAAGAGMGIGMILLIVGGVAACCICLPLVGVGAIMVPAIQKVREAAANAKTINNARQIALACQNYHDQNRHLPSPKMGPDLSWRVSILPMVEQIGLYNDFDKAQGWDSPKNKPLSDRMPIMPYGAAADNKSTSETKFQYFTGPNTPFPDSLTKIRLPGDIPDGTSNTFLCAEAATPVVWSKPADMVVGQGALPLPPDRFVAAMMDGSARIIRRSGANDTVLRNAINPRDNQPLPIGWGE